MRKLSLLLAILLLLGCFSGCQNGSTCDGTTAASGTTLPSAAQTESGTPTVPTSSAALQSDDTWPTLSQDRKTIIELAWQVSLLRGNGLRDAYFQDMSPDVGRPQNGIRYYGTYVLGEGADRYAYDILYIPTLDLDVPSMIDLGGYRFVSRCAFHLYAFKYRVNEQNDGRYLNFYSLRKFYFADSAETQTMLDQIHSIHKAYETAIYGYSLGMLPEISEIEEVERIQSVWLTCTSRHISEDRIAERYYGSFDGYDIFEFSDGLYQYIANSSSQTIGAYTFTETRTIIDIMGNEVLDYFELYAIKNGELKTLKEVYDAGYICEESLAEVHKIFQERRENAE